MKDFSSLRFEVWTDGRFDAMSIRAERPDNAEGLRHVWFVLSSAELAAINAGKVSTAEDGYHKVIIHGDTWTFYDLDTGTHRKAGTFSSPYYMANMPRTFMRAVERLAKKTWRLLRKGRAECEAAKGDTYSLPHRITIEVSQAHRDRVEYLYGQGLGAVDVQFAEYREDETRERWAKLLESQDDFGRMAERLSCIARNSTWGFHQRARLIVSLDGESFYWTAIDPKGRRIMNGGLINHGPARGQDHDWSIHT